MGYYDYKTNTLVMATATVLVADALIKYHNTKSPNSLNPNKQGKKQKKTEFSLASSLIAIAVLIIVMSFINSQVPEFGQPFTILVLVVALMKAAPDFASWYKTAVPQ